MSPDDSVLSARPTGPPTARAGDGRAKERQIKKDGVLLASAGFALALLCLAYFRVTGLTEQGSPRLLAALAAVTAGVQAVLWWIPHRGLDRKLRFDPDYVYLPLTGAAVLLASYIAAVPEARDLLLIGWFAALMFGLRFLGFRDVIGYGVLIVALYGAALLVHAGDPGVPAITWQVEGTRAAIVLGIHVFAAGIFERVRRERSEKDELREKLAREAVTDPLTGVRNRRYLQEFLDTAVAQARRSDGRCSLAMIDLDHFKLYNDAHGHLAGDRVLKTVADVLRSEAREADVVARYGGEEFSVVLPETGWEDARVAGERIRRTVQQADIQGENALPDGVTVSVGVATFPEHADSAQDLLQAADRALYQAKDRGRNQVVAGALREE